MKCSAQKLPCFFLSLLWHKFYYDKLCFNKLREEKSEKIFNDSLQIVDE